MLRKVSRKTGYFRIEGLSLGMIGQISFWSATQLDNWKPFAALLLSSIFR